MISNSFRALFSVRATHAYLAGTDSGCLQFSPTAATTRLIAKYGFKVRHMATGFDLCSDMATPNGLLFGHISRQTGQTSFDFDFNPIDPYFINFSDLPASQLVRLDYDSGAAGNEHQGAAVMLTAAVSPAGTGHPQGSLAIRFSDIQPGEKDGPCPQFQINFKARATQWQYFIINKSGQPLGDLRIQGKAGAAFSGPRPAITTGGQQALLFTSGDALPLCATPIAAQSFDLASYPHQAGGISPPGGGKLIFKGLPVPDASMLSPDSMSRSAFCSPMYVYV